MPLFFFFFFWRRLLYQQKVPLHLRCLCAFHNSCFHVYIFIPYLPWLTSIWKHIFSPSEVKLEDAAQNCTKLKVLRVCERMKGSYTYFWQCIQRFTGSSGFVYMCLSINRSVQLSVGDDELDDTIKSLSTTR